MITITDKVIQLLKVGYIDCMFKQNQYNYKVCYSKDTKGYYQIVLSINKAKY